jgi:hypothetical protein
MIDSTHPAGSADFLSRLHDGELTPAESSAFESHRAACAACREAEVEFERSLAAFRAAEPVPVPSDLSARILRKIRAQSPSRRPFGVMFGIDIRWAGVFLAALLVAIIAPALLTRRETPQTASAPDAISAHIVEPESDKDAALREEPPSRAQEVPRAPEAKARARSKEKEELSGRVAAPAPPPPPAAAPAQSAADEVAQRPQPAREAERPAPSALSKHAAASAERAGGEAGNAGAETKAAEGVRLEVRPLDGEGSPPEIAATPSDERLGPLRGREFILTVEAGGRVSGVAPVRPEPGSALRKDAAASPESEAGASPDLLRDLRFQPGGRPRRLLVRVR